MIVVMALLLSIAASCERGPKLPETYPVQGKAVWKNGKPWDVEGARITLQLKSDRKVVAVGVIDKNGDFTVTTNMFGKEKPGAAEGEHTAMVVPPAPPGEALPQIISPHVVKEPVQISPVEMNKITIQVEKL